MKAGFRGDTLLGVFFFFFLQIKSFVLHIKIYYLGFLSVTSDTRDEADKRMEDEHEDFQNGKKNQWIEACGTLGIYSATASQELHVLRHKHGTTQTWDTWPRSRQGHGSIGHDSTKNRKKNQPG